MKILMVCGVFAKENEKEILACAKKNIEYSANIFQEKMIRGFQECECDLEVLSAPFIGSYPNASTIRSFRGFSQAQTKYCYVKFNNIWGLRNISRARSLKKAIRDFIEEKDKEKLILVYSPHTPFLQAAAYAKKKDPSIKICLIVPDLMQYMNLNAKISLPYKIGKKVDIYKFNKLLPWVDSYMLLTDAMREKIEIGQHPYEIVEGIVDADIFAENEEKKKSLKKNPGEKRIVYTGKMNEKFGIKNLVKAFLEMPEPEYRLILCGSGDADDYVRNKAKQDDRIVFLGQVTPEIAAEHVLNADVLVNPRENNEEYTKYSFPSKTIEYLSSGNPVVAHLLSGMPECYAELLYPIKHNDLKGTIAQALSATTQEKTEKYNLTKQHFKNLSGKKVAERIIAMSFNKEV